MIVKRMIIMCSGFGGPLYLVNMRLKHLTLVNLTSATKSKNGYNRKYEKL